MAVSTVSKVKEWQSAAKKWGHILMSWLSGLTAKILVVVIFIGLSAWLVYGQVWRALSSDIGLPVGVTPNPSVNTKILQSFFDQQTARRNHRTVLFGASKAVHPVASPVK